MKLSVLDICIIVCYLLAVIVLGLVLKKRAAKDKEAYMLGGKTLPWYMLGLSNASDMFDISGTMWMVSLAFVYGLKSLWIPWLWPVFNQVFMMMYLSVWLRRSNVTTGAEWIGTRFGRGKGVKASHTIVVVFALLSCLGFLAYGFVGLGKFVEIFIPFQSIAPYLPFSVSPEYVAPFYGIIFTAFAVFYAILGGMTSIVIGDVMKYVIMTISALVIAVIAMDNLSGKTLAVPQGWYTPFFSWRLDDLDWTGMMEEVNDKIQSDGFSLFGVFFMMMLFKGVLASLAGPAPNYDMQKILSTKSPQEAARMSGFVSIVLLPVRYAMIMGLTVLALLNFDHLNLHGTHGIDFEKILPAAILHFVPAGLMGLLLAGLLAAFMGTFAGTLNAAQAYIVNDIYLKYVNPGASNHRISRMNYLSGLTVALIGILLGLFAKDVNSILQWIVSALYGGYIAANVLKWHWWRFNASGFFWGMVAGIIPALIFPVVFPHTLSLYYFPLLFVISLAGCVCGSLVTPATNIDTLKTFYRTVRPWGFWKPIQALVQQEDPDFQPNSDFRKDTLNVVVGIIAQCTLTLAPMYWVLKMNLELSVTLLALGVCIFILKRTWWDHLYDEPPLVKGNRLTKTLDDFPR
ncbi:sodium:solute symporter [Siphonobacter sp. SORGH_AS_0500]|uniref:sodium:solute symporter family protein n=1 Tax=Siphonobacter sp. SORGH_AS_0500 TaxID=1864824 RepID=UPI000CB85C21|nr:sodium:solute symporter family protein [Siphonobacter sp. SORGH_AS_0500]PKK37476.1 sodium:solute symporter [Siphonobacter sp. SORGH_AS_0500]